MAELRRDRARSAAILPSLKGKLLLAASHPEGECAQIATQMIMHYEPGGAKHKDFETLCSAIGNVLRVLRSAGPRAISLWSEQPPRVIFADGACEDAFRLFTHGAVMVDGSSRRREVFGHEIRLAFVNEWKKSGKPQLIFLAEIFPVWVSLVTWRQRRETGGCSSSSIYREAAKASLIKDYSPILDAAEMLSQLFFEVFSLRAMPWFCRVPSKSNIADAASHLDFGDYGDEFVQVTASYPGLCNAGVPADQG